MKLLSVNALLDGCLSGEYAQCCLYRPSPWEGILLDLIKRIMFRVNANKATPKGSLIFLFNLLFNVYIRI